MSVLFLSILLLKMRKPLLLFRTVATVLAIVAGLTAWAQTARPVTVYGSIISSTQWSAGAQPGIYSFAASPSPGFTPVKTGAGLTAQGGGVLAGDVYYSINGDLQMLSAYDVETWDLLYSRPMSTMTLDMTYDPTTGRVYGCFVDGGAQLGILQPETGSYDRVGSLSGTLSALFCSNDGTLYGISAGMLVRIDKTSGEMEYLQPTGLNPMFAQSATVDPTSGRCYWAAMQSDMSSALYEINLQTAACTFIKSFPGNEEITGLFILPQSPDKAPSAVTTLTADFPQGALTGTIDFMMPTTTNDGTALAGAIGYRIAVSGDTLTGTAQPGSKVSRTLTLEKGQRKVVVTATNDAGSSDKAVVSLWLGADTPAAVGDLRLRRTATTADGRQQATLSWTAPVAGEHGGWIDTSKLTYTVVRQPDGQTIAASTTATRLENLDLPADTLGKHWFTVTPQVGGTMGNVAVSNRVIAGPALSVPYDGRFDSHADFDYYTITDADEDGKTWSWEQGGGAAHVSGDAEHASDDWLITPPVQLSKAGFYKLTFAARCLSDRSHRLSVMLGALPEAEDMITTVMPVTDVSTRFDDQTFEARFLVPADGAYYLGFRLTSDAMSQPFDLDNIRVEQMTSTSAPAAVTDFTVTPGAQGALTADVSFVLPVTTIGGESLTGLTRASLYRNDSLIYTEQGDAVSPGKRLSYTDNTVQRGLNAYRVEVANASGAGNDTTVTAYVGIDVPAAVANVQALETADGVLVVTWDAPTTGAHGGYIDPASLTYTVKRNGWFDVSASSATLSAIDTITDLGNRQRWVSYSVAATSMAGTGAETVSPYVSAGRPYAVPLKESFANGLVSYGDWTSFPIMGEQSWMPTYNEHAQDSDLGTISYANYGQAAPCRLMSPKISLKGTLRPTLSFWMSNSDVADSLRVLIYSPDGSAQTVSVIDLNGGQNEWRQYGIDLAPFAGQAYVQLGFATLRVPGSAKLSIDNIQIIDGLDCNLEATGLKVPTSLRAETEKEVQAVVTNVGLKAVDAYSVRFYNGDILLATVAGKGLKPGVSAEVACTLKPTVRDHGLIRLMAVVSCEGDENAINDTVRADIPVSAPDLPMATGVTAAWNGSSVGLSWSAPDFDQLPPASITDNFESYESFTISNLTPWTIVDKGGNLYSMEFQTKDGNWITYPHSGDAISFQVIDLTQIGATEADGWSSVSGNKILISPYTGSKKQDWLISPLLYEGAQTVRVNAKSLNNHDYGLETLRIYISTTDDNPDNFTLLAEQTDVPEQWTEYSFDLPSDVNYFAIVATEVKSALMLDDITYVPDGAPARQYGLRGYNVWRDGVLLNAEPMATTSYTDRDVTEGRDYAYQLTVVYDEGESDYTSPVTVTTTGISTAVRQSVIVEAGQGFVAVSAAEGQAVSLWTTDGRLVAQAVTRGTWQVAPGCYIVKAGGETRKIVVR